MSDAKSNDFETALLGLIFNATSIASLAGDATSPTSLLSVALHTADPTDTGNQGSSECVYTSYARVQVARNSSGWTVSGSTVQPSTTISFPQATGGSETATHFSVGMSTVTTSNILYMGTISPNISISNGVTPQLTTATVITEA